MEKWTRDSASFRDPSGFVFTRDGILYRQVNESFGAQYRLLMDSGLYAELTGSGLLLDHEEVPLRLEGAPCAHAVLRPRLVPFISYPYEWCHGQLKAAALLTLEVQKRAIARGLVLRDASAYNVQFVGGRPLLIDTLSFGQLIDGEPWQAYRQFCQHFLAPLALMSYVDASLVSLLRIHIDGIPLALAARLLPFSTRFRAGLLAHLHAHARYVARRSDLPPDAARVASRRPTMGRAALLGLIDSLEGTVKRLTYDPRKTVWADYYAHTNYSPRAEQHKQELVAGMIQTARTRRPVATIWDLGANTGVYSRVAAASGARVIGFDVDPGAVEQHYRDCVARGETNVLPLVQDLTNPSPGIGWNCQERRSFVERGPADLCLALALVHHLAIGNNVPLDEMARFLRSISRMLILEFVPKADSQVQRMLSVRADIFPNYDQESLESAFQREFRVLERTRIDDSLRTLYLLEAL